MAFEIEYFHERVLAEIESWPVAVLADYARLVDLLTEYGPAFAFRILEPLAMDCSNCDLVVDQASPGPSTASWWSDVSWYCTLSSRSPKKRRIVS